MPSPDRSIRVETTRYPNRVSYDYRDYRLSHLRKGASYHESFERNPWRAYVWQQEKRVLDAILDQYFPEGAVTHLDFACGTGRILHHLSNRTVESVGVDISLSMLQVARKTMPQAELICTDITRTDILGTRKFNLITVFRFFPNAQTDLRIEAIRCLRNHLDTDGILVFNNHKNATSLRYRIARLLCRHNITMGKHDIHILMESGCFRIINVFSIGVLPATERCMLTLAKVHRAVDAIADICRIAGLVAQDLIFVCRPIAADPKIC